MNAALDSHSARRLGMAAIAALAALALLTACSARQSGEAEPPPAPANLERGGVLGLVVNARPPHLDPHQTVSSATLNWSAGLVYSRLFRFRAAAEDLNDGQVTLSRVVECDLCQSWRQTGSRSFEVTLRPGLKWQDAPPLNGRPLTAQDIVDSYERQGSPGFASAALLKNFSGFQAVDNLTLSISLHEPDAEALEKLAHAGSSIVPPELYRADPDAVIQDAAVGSGPWMLEEIADNYTFRANPDYYEVDADGNRLPYMDGITLRVVADTPRTGNENLDIAPALTRADAVKTRNFDVAPLAPALLEDNAPSSSTSHHILTILDPSAGVEVLFNTSAAFLDTPEFRRAALLSWNLAPFTRQAWGPAAAPSSGLSFPDPALREGEAAVPDFTADIAEANRLLSGINFNPTEVLTITVGDFSNQHLMLGELMRDGLQSLGVQAEVQVVTTRRYAENVWLNGEYQIAVGAPPPVFTVTDKLLSFHHSSGPSNTTGYNDAALDRLIESQASEYNLSRRTEELEQIEELLAEQAQRLNLAGGAAYWIVGNCVQNMVPNTAGSNSFFLARTWLEGDACDRPF